MNFIDIHSHILPGVDDGARDLQQTLAMAKAASYDGVTALVATPHVIKGVFDNHKADILQQVLNVDFYLKHCGLKMPILPGAEYYLEPNLAERLAAGTLLTINDTGRYLLVELPATMVPDYTDQILYEIQLQGVTPIIAHPERNLGLAKKPQMLQEWARRGILAQVTSISISGWFGRGAKKRALKFLQTGAAQLIASDGHDARGRAPLINQAFQEIEQLWGTDMARTLTFHNPDLIIRGLPLKPTVPPPSEMPWTDYFKKFRAGSSDKYRF